MWKTFLACIIVLIVTGLWAWCTTSEPQPGEPAASLGDRAGTLPEAVGDLTPRSGLLPAGTTAITLSITTTVPAACRWSDTPAASLAAMPNAFDQGQGDLLHTSRVEGFQDLAERRLYVRCGAADGSSTLPDVQRQTHLRVLGPSSNEFPRIANLYGPYDPTLGPQFYARYDIYIPSWWRDAHTQAAAIRAANPTTKVLVAQNATYGWPGIDTLTTAWRDSVPGDPSYNCLLRDSSGNILYGGTAGPVFFNLTQQYCRDVLVEQNVHDFLAPDEHLGADLAYDGIYWDGLSGTTTWMGADIDSNLDAVPDDFDWLQHVYRAGVEEFIKQVRGRLPYVILTGNDAPYDFAPWLDGKFYEWQVPAILDGAEAPTWSSWLADYRLWEEDTPAPQASFVFGAPEKIYSDKYPDEIHKLMPPAMRVDAAENYARMRFGLASTLMADGLFFQDLRQEEGILWWYDEYGAPAGAAASALPERGYLGAPAGDPYLLVDRLDTPDQVLNGSFEAGVDQWRLWVDSHAGAAAQYDVAPGQGISDTAALHVVVTAPADAWDVQLQQAGKSTVAGESYTLSFWARSTVPQTIRIRVAREAFPGTDYGFNVYAQVTPQWQQFHLWGVPNVTADGGEIEFHLGRQAGEFWFDDVRFQAGALGVWARPFEHGLAVVNATHDRQEAPLPQQYCKLAGQQAPLAQTLVDDGQALFSTGWDGRPATTEQYGWTAHVTAGGSKATATYTPTLPFGGTYEVLAWLSPTSGQSPQVAVEIHHAGGVATADLNEAEGEVGWHSLGVYSFPAGTSSNVTLLATGGGEVVADAFKWASTARYNDGSVVSQVELDPQDGIILLASCTVGSRRLYLPFLVEPRN